MYDVSFYTASTVNITVTMQKCVRGYNDLFINQYDSFAKWSKQIRRLPLTCRWMRLSTQGHQ